MSTSEPGEKDAKLSTEADAKPTPKPKPTKAKEPQEKTRSSSNSGWGAVAILILIIGGISWAAYYYLWPQWQAQSQTLTRQASDLENLRDSVDERLTSAQRSQQQQLQSQLDAFSATTERQLNQQAANLDQLQRAVQSVQAEVANLDLSQASTWRLFEARNLVQRAATRLWIEHDLGAALQLLVLAQSHLEALNNPAHMAARQALANDIMALRGLPGDQRESAAMVLTSVRAQLADADWYQRRVSAFADSIERPEVDSWWASLQRSGQTLMDQFIRVQRQEQPITPLLSDSFVALSQQRLLLQLQLAQQAALAGSQAVFEASIQEALRLLETLGNAPDQRLQTAREALLSLQQLQLRPDYPADLESLDLIERLARNAGAEANS
ncbi:uroporphyrinogen-III C-methyltransferase [Pseudidiomarina aestuarii]|uniref:uroporphyrinogen-III C-methyltransferase n=1 Tax=Pseudidiomarina aestuarii TaxID=624146 RepID=UPI003A96FAE4